MLDFWGEKNFDTLHNEFISNSSGGKIFMMKKCEYQDTVLGKGVTIILRKATGFLLNILKEQYLLNADAMIGDVKLLFHLVSINSKKALKKCNLTKAQNETIRAKRKLQLHNILRKQRGLKSLKFKIKLHKKEEQ
mgnify:CR=1 FL=1|jgi:hypothetical protein